MLHQFIAQLNQYLHGKQRDFQLQGGYCHGLTLLWLHVMSQKHESWFYQTVESVMSCKNDFSEIENDVEKFIAHIEWLQHSGHYEYAVNQLDVSELTGLNLDGSLSFLVRPVVIDFLIQCVVQENKYICLSSRDHTVGLVRCDGVTYLFDINFAGLKPKAFRDNDELKYALVKSLYRRDYLPDVRLPLHVNVLSCQPNTENQMREIYENLVAEHDDLNAPGFERMTNLYLACERGDEKMVEDLLRKNVDPNKHVNTWTPLHVAAAHGHRSIVKALVKFGAITGAKTEHGLTAKDLAEAYHHDDVVKLL